MLFIDSDIGISFQEAWIEELSKLPYEQFGEYIKGRIYPELPDKDQKIWNKNTISNKKLHEAISEFIAKGTT